MKRDYDQLYGCHNCNRQNNPCRSNKRDCKLDVCMAEHLVEDESKTKSLVKMLANLKMIVKVNSNGFQIVSIA